MKSVAINFTRKGVASLSLTQYVEGAKNTGQKAAVNVVTRRGSDSIHPLRGTTLHVEASDGLLIDTQSAMHSTNFAGLETRKFLRANAPAGASASDLAKDVALQLTDFSGSVATTSLYVKLDSGETFGTELSSAL